MYAKVIADKHEDVMAKFGAILAQGIIDAGGRNCTVSLMSRTGHTNMEAVVGMLVFCQHWFWYPLAHFLSLAFKPACLIGLNADLKMPKVEFRSNARPSMFAYPPVLEEKKDKAKEKVETAVLSITAKQKKKELEKKKDSQTTVSSQSSAEPMEVDESSKKDSAVKKDKKKDEKASTSNDTNKNAGHEDSSESLLTDSAAEKKEKEPEPNFEILSNPARTMKAQLKVISLEGSRYSPVKDLSHGGIIMLKNSKPGESEEIVETVQAGGPKAEEEEEEPEPPEPFEYTEDWGGLMSCLILFKSPRLYEWIRGNVAQAEIFFHEH